MMKAPLSFSLSNTNSNSKYNQRLRRKLKWVLSLGLTIAVIQIAKFQRVEHTTLLLTLSEATTFTSSSDSNEDESNNGKHDALLSQIMETSVPSMEYPPLSCPALLKHVEQEQAHKGSHHHHHGLIVQDPNQRKLFARMTKYPPHFYISLHNPKFDPTRWSIMDWGEYYERELTTAFSTVLNATHGNTRILDVGGNIGYFTLLAAAHSSTSKSITVDTFEPNLKNALRLCESLYLNHWPNELESNSKLRKSTTTTTLSMTSELYKARANWSSVSQFTPSPASKVNCYPYGVGSQVGTLHFAENKNPGAGQLVANDVVNNSNNNNNNTRSVSVVTLDAFAASRGWLGDAPNEVPDIALMKVDVEGHEHHVLQGASRLLQSHLIRNIFMEISARTFHEIENTKLTLQAIASSGYDVHQYGGFRGPKHTVNWSCANVTHLVDLVIREVTKKKHPQLNLWWKLAKV